MIKHPVWLLLLCIFVHFTAYAPGLPESMTSIDDEELTQIPQIQTQPSLQSLKSIWTVGSHIDFYPLRDMSYLIDTHILGSTTLAYRTHQFILFYFCVFFIYILLQQLGLNNWFSFFITSFWAFNPYHSEMLMWISARKDLLSIFYILLSSLFFVYAFQRQRLWAYFLCIVFFTASLLSKASFSGLPLALLILFAFHPPLRQQRKAIITLSCCLLLGLVSSIFQTWFYSVINDMRFFRPWEDRLSGSLEAFGRILAGWFFPSINILDGENGSAWIEDNHFYEIWGIFCWILLIATGLFALVRRHIHLMFSLTLFLTLYLPISGLLFPHRQFYSTRYMEGPILALFISLGSLLIKKITFWFDRLSFRFQKTLFFSSLLYICFLLTLNFFEQKNWENPISVFEKGDLQFPNATRLKLQKYTAMVNFSKQKPPTEEFLTKIKTERAALEKLCNPPDHLIDSVGDDCGDFFKLQWLEVSTKLNPERKEQFFQYFLNSYEKRHPALGRVSRTSLLRHFESGTSENEFLENWLNRYVYTPLPAYRIYKWMILCELDRVKESQDFYRTSLEKKLITNLDLQLTILEVKDPKLQKKIKSCFALAKL